MGYPSGIDTAVVILSLIAIGCSVVFVILYTIDFYMTVTEDEDYWKKFSQKSLKFGTIVEQILFFFPKQNQTCTASCEFSKKQK